MTVEQLERVILTDVQQYRAGCKWLIANGGTGALWKAPPLYPNKSIKQWWANVYGDQYFFWFKDSHVKTLFLLTLPPPANRFEYN